MKQKYREYAELIGMENLTMLSHVFGGSNIYIPKEKELQKRYKRIGRKIWYIRKNNIQSDKKIQIKKVLTVFEGLVTKDML